jgi:hypothetical protein
MSNNEKINWTSSKLNIFLFQNTQDREKKENGRKCSQIAVLMEDFYPVNRIVLTKIRKRFTYYLFTNSTPTNDKIKKCKQGYGKKLSI